MPHLLCGVWLLILLFPWPGSAGAHGAQPPGFPLKEATAIRLAITGQLAAFARDDAQAAFDFASPGIQARFGTPEIFMELVRIGYRPVHRPRHPAFRELAATSNGLIQKVLFIGPDGRPVLTLHTMEREPDGSWRIADCTLVDIEEQSV